jgi:hypothetical protein
MHRLLSTARRRGTALSAVGMVALALTACGGSTPKSGASTTSTTSHGGAASTTTTLLQTSGKAPLTNLGSLEKTLQEAEMATFTATYKLTQNGQTQTLTVEQAPPKSFFKAYQGVVVNNGVGAYYCVKSGTVSCVGITTTDPLESLLNLVSSKEAVFSLLSAQTALASKEAGYTTSFSSATFAGQASTCVSISATTGASKYCVTGAGRLAYVSPSPSQVVELTSYSTKVHPADFVLPSGTQL